MQPVRSRAYAATFIIICLMILPAAWGQSWSSSASVGLTKVEWRLSGFTYTWTLTNLSGPADGLPDYDLLVWSLQPFRVPAPVSWVAPQGWEWNGQGHQSFRLISSANSYSSPPALAPGESVEFTYTFDPSAPLVNSQGEQPDSLAFLSHVAAVGSVPTESGGVREWEPVSDPTRGRSWYDAASSSEQSTGDTPEPSGALVCALGSAWLFTCLTRYGRRASASRSGRSAGR